MRIFGQAIFGAMSLLATSAMGATLSGFGTATVDGVLAPGEWEPAGSVTFLVNTPGGGTAPATLWAMNDAINLFLGVEIAGTYERIGVDFEFDVDGSDTISDGDDAVVLNADVGYRDSVRTSSPAVCALPGGLCGVPDTLVGGALNGTGAINETLATTVFEVVKPLNSGDPNDFVLTGGDVIGLSTFVRIIEAGMIGDTKRDYPIDSIAIAPVPVPAALGLMGSTIGLGFVFGGFRRRRNPSLTS